MARFNWSRAREGARNTAAWSKLVLSTDKTLSADIVEIFERIISTAEEFQGPVEDDNHAWNEYCRALRRWIDHPAKSDTVRRWELENSIILKDRRTVAEFSPEGRLVPKTAVSA